MSKTKESILAEETVSAKKKCGIVMPIAEHPDYPANHWIDVQHIIKEAVNQTEFEPCMVNDDDAIGLIHDRIVTNLYSNEMVICDVSSKNPNVMFELGLRLAFDKPTIIIKDEKTGYTFDAGVIEHLTYPSSLRFAEIVKFKSDLKKRIEATYKISTELPDFSPFLKSFNKKIVPTKIEGQEIPEMKAILSSMNDLQRSFRYLRSELINPQRELIGDERRVGTNDLIISEIQRYVERNGIISSREEFESLTVYIRDRLNFNVTVNKLHSLGVSLGLINPDALSKK